MSTLIQHRYVTCLQRRGNLGKSTLIAALAQWLDQRGVMWRAMIWIRTTAVSRACSSLGGAARTRQRTGNRSHQNCPR